MLCVGVHSPGITLDDQQRPVLAPQLIERLVNGVWVTPLSVTGYKYPMQLCVPRITHSDIPGMVLAGSGLWYRSHVTVYRFTEMGCVTFPHFL
jgi:hypothetical protein